MIFVPLGGVVSKIFLHDSAEGLGHIFPSSVSGWVYRI